MEATIIDPAIAVTCEVPTYQESMLSTLLARGGNLVRAFSDIVSFATGIGFVITWETFKLDDSEALKIQNVNAYLVPLCKSLTFPPRNVIEQLEFEKVLRLVLTEPNLMGSLTDLADTLSHFHQTPTNCARVLDSLKKAVAPNSKDAQGWAILRDLLRLSTAFVQFVTDHSKGPRHGDRTSTIPSSTIEEVSKRTWQIVDRFIEYRKRGSKPLPVSEFPEL
jgi:hypothetical protein